MRVKRNEPAQVTAIPLAVVHGLLVVPGYGLRIWVEHGRLQVRNSYVGTEAHIELTRATAGLKRLVVIGHSGFITFDAVRWLHDVGASYTQIDADGKLLASYAPLATNDVGLRRAQALAATGDVGFGIAKRLITDKVEAQERLLTAIALVDESGLRPIVEARAHIAQAANADELRWCEATAAAAYWNALATSPIRFVRAEQRRVPNHWRVFGSRYSTITNRTTKAVTPAAAITNYLYAILESESRKALLARGLDPEIGMLHSLQRSRSSMALDVMKPVRPAVDQFVLDLLARRVFSARDFAETREGSCRLMPDIARVLANTAPRWSTLIEPVVAWVAGELLRSRPAPLQNATIARSRFPGALHRRTPNGSLPDAPVAPTARCEELRGADESGAVREMRHLREGASGASGADPRGRPSPGPYASGGC